MSTELARVTAALEALADDATPEQVAAAIRGYSKRDIAAAMFSLTDGGEGGGSVPESLLAFTSVQISSAQILDIDNTSVELLPAPGGRFYYVVQSAFLHYRFGTTPYTGDSSYLAIGYGPSPIAYYMAVVGGDGPTFPPGDLLLQTEDAYAAMFLYETNASASWLFGEIENRALMFGAPGGAVGAADGDGTLTVRLWYSLIDGAP